MNKRTVRIFISSPTDVAEERQLAAKVIERLNGVHGDRVTLEAVLWEQQVYDANRSFQEQITAMREMDLVVGILWKRIGSVLPPDRFRRDDGSPYESGTVFELEAALACDGRPSVYVFKKTAPIFYSKETFDEEKHQGDLLDAWWDRAFHDAERHYLRGDEPFATPDAFERRLMVAVENWLDAEGLVPRGPTWDITKQSPFPGLQAYDLDRSSVFFWPGSRHRRGGRVAAAEHQSPRPQAGAADHRRQRLGQIVARSRGHYAALDDTGYCS